MTKLQKEGALTEEKVLDHAVKMMNLVQECNVLLKWMMLHTAPLSQGNRLFSDYSLKIIYLPKLNHTHLLEIVVKTFHTKNGATYIFFDFLCQKLQLLKANLTI